MLDSLQVERAAEVDGAGQARGVHAEHLVDHNELWMLPEGDLG